MEIKKEHKSVKFKTFDGFISFCAHDCFCKKVDISMNLVHEFCGGNIKISKTKSYNSDFTNSRCILISADCSKCNRNKILFKIRE